MKKLTTLILLLVLSSPAACAPRPQAALPLAMTPVTGTDTPASPAQTAVPATAAAMPSPPLNGLKPPDSDTPASGICADGLGDPISIILGSGPDGLPLAGRCIRITPAQRIRLVNGSGGPLQASFAGYQLDLPVGGEMLLDKPVGAYLALGVHILPAGPELWVAAAGGITPVVTAPPPIVQYENSSVGYRLGLPADWRIDESGVTNGMNKEVLFSPPYAEPFIAYLSISLDSRTLDQVISSYAQNRPDAIREDTIFNGYTAIKYSLSGGHTEYFVPYGNQLFLIATDRPNDGTVQSILMTVRFTAPPSTTYEATIMDNGQTFTLRVGDYLRLNLDWSYDWSGVSISNPGVIAGVQDAYQGLASGTATLSAVGNPKCLNSTPPCGMPSIMFTITVVVQ